MRPSLSAALARQYHEYDQAYPARPGRDFAGHGDQVECAIIGEISLVNCHAIDVPREKLEQSTSHTLSVGEAGSAKGGRVRKAASAEASHAGFNPVDASRTKSRPCKAP
jgi:hypothetical protein